jgi:hypothetical protein
MNTRNQSSLKLDVEALRRAAHTLKKAKGIQHSQALDQVARSYGFSKWTELISAQNSEDRLEQRRARQPYTLRDGAGGHSLEDQPPEGAHRSPYENPSYVKRIFRP